MSTDPHVSTDARRIAEAVSGHRRESVTVRPTLDHAPLRDAAYVGARLAIPPKSVLQYAREGRLPCVRIGKHVRFVMAEVERAILDARTV